MFEHLPCVHRACNVKSAFLDLFCLLRVHSVRHGLHEFAGVHCAYEYMGFSCVHSACFVITLVAADSLRLCVLSACCGFPELVCSLCLLWIP